MNVNRDIRAKEVRVIDADGEQAGILSIEDALELAENQDLDLVEVSPNAQPPVCKIMDHGKYRYELTKKKQDAKKKQRNVQIKEIKVRPKTGDHDLETKARHIQKFIEKNDKVKITLMFRGREIILKDQANEVMEKVVDLTKDYAVVDQPPKFEGRMITMMLAPK